MSDEQKQSTASEPITVKEFFEKIPPGRSVAVKGLCIKEESKYGSSHRFMLPVLELHCTTEKCNGIRFFETQRSKTLSPNSIEEDFINYTCKNCEKVTKTYALRSFLSKDGLTGELFKFGEVPAFGPPTAARLITLVGGEREYYLKGRRAENQGLGIAAFAYYRRVVENQKNKILDEIIRVAEKIGASKDILSDLDSAKKETQFSKAVSAVKHGMPQILLINGHNPLILLHSALSDGLHAQTDEQCLELATSIRVVLSELVDRLAYALKDEAELNVAVTRLLKVNSTKSG